MGNWFYFWPFQLLPALELPAVMRTAVETLDPEGRRLIPGLIDGHVHICGGGGEAGFRTRVPPLPLSGYTSAGITTVIGLLGTDGACKSVTFYMLAGNIQPAEGRVCIDGVDVTHRAMHERVRLGVSYLP